MANVPSNLIPVRVTKLQFSPVASEDGLLLYVYEGVSYKIRAGDLLSVAGVPTSRQVIAGTALTGGGPLSSDVTLSVANGGIGTAQLASSGVTPGVYGDSTSIPVITVDATGRVMAATTSSIVVSGYVPTSRQVIAGTGLSGGGSLSSDVTLSANFSSSTPLSGDSSGSAGSGVTMSRADHQHPAVDLADLNEVNGILGLSNGGTARSLVMQPGAVIWSGSDGFYVGPAGVSGQVLVSGGTSAPTWGSALIVSPQLANYFFAGPSSGAAADATFRLMEISDLPDSGVAPSTYGSSTTIPVFTVNAKGQITAVTNTAIPAGTVTSVSVSGGTTGLTTSGSPITSSGTITLSGTLIPGNGGTGISTYSAGDMLYASGTSTLSRLAAGTSGQVLTSAGASAPVWTTLSSGTVTSVNVSGGTTGLTSSGGPVTTSGTITLAGTLIAANGGTGFATYTVGDILYASTTTALSKLSDVATGNALISGGVGVPPAWGKIDLTTHVSGTLPIANGGTNGTAAPTAGAVPYGTGTAFGFTAAGTSGQVLTSAGAGIPTWTTPTTGTVTSVAVSGGTTGLTTSGGPITSSGTITLAGTLAVANGGTGLATYATGDIVYASGATTISKLALGTTNYVLTAGASAPQYVAQSTLSVGSATTATNLAGGAASQIPYQTGASATSFLANGTAGQVLTSAGAGTPVWSGLDGGTF